MELQFNDYIHVIGRIRPRRPKLLQATAEPAVRHPSKAGTREGGMSIRGLERRDRRQQLKRSEIGDAMGALSTGFRVLDGKKDRSGQKYFKDRAVTPIHTGPSHPVNPVSKNGSSPVFGREEWTPGFNFGSLRAKDAHSTTLPPKLPGLEVVCLIAC